MFKPHIYNLLSTSAENLFHSEILKGLYHKPVIRFRHLFSSLLMGSFPPFSFFLPIHL